MAQVVTCLPRKHKVPGSNSCTTKKKLRESENFYGRARLAAQECSSRPPKEEKGPALQLAMDFLWGILSNTAIFPSEPPEPRAAHSQHQEGKLARHRTERPGEPLTLGGLEEASRECWDVEPVGLEFVEEVGQGPSGHRALVPQDPMQTSSSSQLTRLL
jgi:hypothetical protein